MAKKSENKKGLVDKKSEIKKGLVDQLEQKGIKQEHYLDLIEDYMAMWEIKNKLIKDIEERGVSIYWCNGGGQEGYKKNDSIAELTKTNAQMLKILNELGLKPEKREPDDNKEEM